MKKIYNKIFSTLEWINHAKNPINQTKVTVSAYIEFILLIAIAVLFLFKFCNLHFATINFSFEFATTCGRLTVEWQIKKDIKQQFLKSF